MCQANCPFMVNTTTYSAQTKLCHLDDDCTGYQGNLPLIGLTQLNYCCSNANAPGLHFCALPLSIGGFDIQCP